VDRPPPETGLRSTVLTLCEVGASILLEASASYVVETIVSFSGVPPWLVVPVLVVSAAGIHYVARRLRQRKG
jgi:hypothetical protein